jgi:phage shock protein PspC (stress-responsive transcriptional regulator)
MNTTYTSPEDSKTSYDNHQDGFGPESRLERPVQGRMVAGVAAGTARMLGVDPTVVRIIFAVLVVVGGFGIPLYLAGWLLIPEEGRQQSLASDLIQSFQSKSR